MRRHLAILLLLSFPCACDKKADEKADKKADAKTDAKADAKTDDKAGDKTDDKAGDKADAEADEEGDAKADAEADAEAEGTERTEATIKDHTATQLEALVTVAKGGKAEKFGLVEVTALDGMKIARGGGGDGGETYAMSGLAAAVAAYAHNPAGDSGEDCPTLEDVKKAIGAAEVDAEKRLSTSWDGEGPMYGNEIDLLMFHEGDKSGFYVRHRFDHGDDYTDFCAATGTPQAPVANASADDAKAIAGAFVTARENL